MIDIHEAHDRLLKCLNRRFLNTPQSIVILEHMTIERPYGWVFFCESKQYGETQNPNGKLDTIGDGLLPIIVEKTDGTMTSLKSTYHLEKRIRGFEIRRFGTSNYGTTDAYY